MISTHRRILLLVVIAALLWLLGPLGRLAVVSVLLLFGPGYLVDTILLQIVPTTPFARPTIWLGLSVSLLALLYEWVTTVGFALTTALLAGLALCCVIGIVLVMWRDTSKIVRIGLPAPALWLCGIFALTLGLRFYQIRTLRLPNWVDSVHHALMIRVAIERGQAPLDLTPYLQVTQLPYHWGYHVFAAASAQLSAVSVPEVMLWQGQLLNALHVLTVAALAAAIWRKPWAGVVAGLVVGLVSLMPAFYTSWGRYTQLLGLLLLPPLAICWQALLHKPRAQQAAAVALCLAGLNLVHIRVLIFALCLLASLTCVWALEHRATNDGRLTTHTGQGFSIRNRRSFTVVLACTAASAAAVALTAPWLWLLAERQVRSVVAQPAAFFSGDLYGGIDLNLLWSGPNRWLVALALAGALCGIRRASGAALSIIIWVASLFTLANPQMLPYLLPAAALAIATWALPQRKWLWALAAVPLLLCNPLLIRPQSSWLITNDVIIIALFVPLAVMVGGLADLLFAYVWLPQRIRSLAWRSRLLSGVIALVAAWGTWNSRTIIRPSTVLATPADLPAITWAAQHTPPDARFLIGATPWFGSAARGVDGGWWLLPLAGRWASTPPVLFLYGQAGDVQETIARNTLVAEFQPAQADALLAMLTHERISYVYLTKQSGEIAQAFDDSQRFPIVYQGDGVRILAVLPQP